jgi:hypothetical protein
MKKIHLMPFPQIARIKPEKYSIFIEFIILAESAKQSLEFLQIFNLIFVRIKLLYKFYKSRFFSEI